MTKALDVGEENVIISLLILHLTKIEIHQTHPTFYEVYNMNALFDSQEYFTSYSYALLLIKTQPAL